MSQLHVWMSSLDNNCTKIEKADFFILFFRSNLVAFIYDEWFAQPLPSSILPMTLQYISHSLIDTHTSTVWYCIYLVSSWNQVILM